ncbi:MAG: AAA family ATPase [Muribaculaceae bacterium]|nr:AAA family ATPase [Muribaculaceae bacterium]
MELVENPTEPEYQGMLRIQSANEWIQEAQSRPDPKPLYLSLWYEGEVCCLFADSNLGKSIFAVQIANEIAKGQKVIYFDFELSAKQFQLRYSDEYGNLYNFPDNFMRAEIDPDLLSTDSDFEEEVIRNIEDAAVKLDCRVLVIDNITYLNSVTEKSDAASRLMMKLMQLKKKHGLSILILAHTPKRNLSSPITQNDLAGSKRLFNFFDSVLAIGKSAKDESLRYVKQIKVRAGAFEYSAENIIVCQIIKERAFLHFETLGYANERDHLREQSEKDVSALQDRVREMSEAGKTQRQIAESLGISLGKVNKILKEQR